MVLNGIERLAHSRHLFAVFAPLLAELLDKHLQVSRSLLNGKAIYRLADKRKDGVQCERRTKHDPLIEREIH